MRQRVSVRWPLVRVVWVDSSSPDGWMWLSDLDARDSNLVCVSVGYLITDAPDHLTVAASVAGQEFDDPQIDGIMIIPRGAVQSMKVLARANV